MQRYISAGRLGAEDHRRFGNSGFGSRQTPKHRDTETQRHRELQLLFRTGNFSCSFISLCLYVERSCLSPELHPLRRETLERPVMQEIVGNPRPAGGRSKKSAPAEIPNLDRPPKGCHAARRKKRRRQAYRRYQPTGSVFRRAPGGLNQDYFLSPFAASWMLSPAFSICCPVFSTTLSTSLPARSTGP